MRRLLLFLALLAASPAAGAEDPLTVDCEFGWQGCYRPHRWTPVEVRISGRLTEPFPGRLSLSARSDELTRMTIRHDFVLTPSVPYRTSLVTKLPFGVAACRMAIRDDRGALAWRQEYGLWDMSGDRQQLVSVGPADLLVVGSGRIRFGLRRLGEATHSTAPPVSYEDVFMTHGPTSSGTEPRQSGTVYFCRRIDRRLPADWTAYDAVDLLVLYDVDWTALHPRQAKAVTEWVRGGGSLLVVLGSRPLPAGHALAELVPVAIGEARRTTLPPSALGRWSLGGEADGVTAWPLRIRPGAFGWEAKTYGTGETLFAAGPVGFGRVGVLAFDPSPLADRPGESGARFWVAHMKKVLGGVRTIELGGGPEDSGGLWNYPRDRGAAGTNAILNHLLDIPELEPISIWYVIGLLAALAVVIGPVDYFVLKKRGRLPLTWLTFTCYIGVFSAAALVGVHWVRHGPTQLRIVTVEDYTSSDLDYEGSWTCRHCGIYASDSDDYPLAGLDPRSWWSPVAPVASRWETPDQRQGYRQIACAQGDGGSLPSYLPVSIWSMQCLLSEGPAEGPAPIVANIELDEPTVRATVRNLGEGSVSRGVILFGRDRFVRFGEVPPGESVEIEEPLTAGEPWEKPPDVDEFPMRFGRQPEYRFGPGMAFRAAGNLRRTDAIEAYLEEGATVVVAEYEDAPAPFRLADPRDRKKPFGERRPRRGQVVYHRRLVRLVVMPTEEGLP